MRFIIMNTNNLIHSTRRLLLTLSLVVAMAVTACAYTVVLRSGKRIEIHGQFAVTRTTVTYEAAPGINVTLQMTMIDLPATDRANNEQPGSLLKRAEPAKVQPQTVTRATIPHKSRVITDRDLERFKRQRLESEAAYEKRRLELGLPSLAESRQRAELEAESLHQELIQRRSEEAQAESYWRERANALISEIAATDAQINFVNARLSETPRSSATAFTIVSGYSFANPLAHRRFGPTRSGVFGLPASGGIGFGNGLGQAWGTPANTFRPFRSRQFFPGFQPVFNSPFPYDDNSYDRSGLTAWLDRLVADRVALQARFHMLEEEARRAGAPPGWLRP